MKKALLVLLKLFVTIALFIFLFRKLGFDNILDRVLSVDIRLFLVASVVFLLSMALSALQWKMLLNRQGVELSGMGAFKLYMTGLFFNNFLPGAMGGDIVKVYKLKSELKRGKEGLAATFIDRFAGLFVLCLFALVSAVYLDIHSKIHLGGNLYRYIFGLFSLFVMSIVFIFSRRASAIVYGKVFGKLNPFGLRDKLSDLHSFLYNYRGSKRFYVKIMVLSIITQFMRITVHWLAALSIGFAVSPIYFLVFVPLIALVSSLPLSFGGLGVREGLGQLLFSAAGYNGTMAVATQFIASLVGIFISLLGGVFFIFGKNKRIRS